MGKILVASAGGPASEGVIKSLQKVGHQIIGVGADPYDLAISFADKKYSISLARDPRYGNELLDIIKKEKPDLVHAQNDEEVFKISEIRESILPHSKLFLPSKDTIRICTNKYESFLKFQSAGLKVPKNVFINNKQDLELSFATLRNSDQEKIWIRSNDISGGGKGSLPTNNFNFACEWIEHHNGWGSFIAAEKLTSETVTWQSIWKDGELIVAQTRKRAGWVHGNRTVSGVTGVTRVGVTHSDTEIDSLAIKAIYAVDDRPNGIFGVDFALDKNGVANPTEINIGRFFTTILFFTTAGLNMPEIYVNLALKGQKYNKEIFNPLPNDLLWVRSMDKNPILVTEKDLI